MHDNMHGLHHTNTRFVALDTETTGTNPHASRIIELTCIEVNEHLEAIGGLHRRSNPGIPIPPKASAVHGIYDEDVKDEPPFHQMAPRIQQLLQDAVIIAYNGRHFDVPLIHNELASAGQPGLATNHPIIDPYKMFVEEPPRTLQGAVQHYLHRDHRNPHDSHMDVNEMLSVLRIQRERRHPFPACLNSLIHQEKRHWLDHGKKFYRSHDDGSIRFGFGKNRGESVRNHHSYLKWMTKGQFSMETKQLAKQFLQDTTEPPGFESSLQGSEHQ